ncbi:family 16 glycoside hydrolase [Synechocystis sp. PCC 7509]|uniref:family 16 glycoside hydrolase n=1 Tax=Synechocystis sp. PCC 7509 TaxID=927677 RepID=UPI0002AC5183|nr:family 16 glycoside hydrolase [Synechocystis sp. PCC 7509]
MPLKKLVTSNNPNQDNSAIGDIQENTFSRDALSRFVFNTLEEAQSAALEGFDLIVVGAGMYGAYCATKLFNFTKNLPGYRPRILVLQEGPFLVHEHFQNLPRGLGSLYDIPLAPLLPEGQYKIINSDGTPEGQGVQFGRDFAGKFRPHHRCVGGKGLFWGGWTPSLTTADLDQWPAAVSAFLNSPDGYSFVSQEIGADYDIDRDGKEKDFIYGTLYESLLKRSRTVVPFSLASEKYSIDRVLQPPIAVKVEAELSGMFSPDKYSSLPGLIEAVREDIGLAAGSDRNRRLFVVPNVKVLNFVTQDAVVRGVRVAVNDPVGQGEVVWNNPLPVSEQGMVVLAANCINSTRLARNSFPRPAIITPERMGANLMVHIRGNYLWQVRRTILEAIDPTLVNQLFEQAALQVEGTAVDLGNGTTGRFHFQFYAAPNAGGNAEEYLYQMMPDRDDLIETIEKLRGVTDDLEWVTFGIRTCGEDFGDRNAPVEFGLSSSRSPNTSWMDTSPLAQDQYGIPQGFVQLVETQQALNLRQAQRAAAFQFIARLVNVSVAEVGNSDSNPDDPNLKVRLVSAVEDGLGTTYHECGTLWMGDDPETSVTDANGRFHHVANAYCVDQALFTTAGSANPVPTGLGLARKVARSITKRYQEELPFADDDAGFLNLFNGSFAGMWRTAGTANFQAITLPGQPPIIEAGLAGVDSGLGILYYTPKQFKNFVLRLEWKAFSIDANSGIFLRIPNPDGVALDNNFYAACTEIQIDETGKNFLASRSPQSVFGGFLEKTGAIYQLAPATQGMSKAIRPRFSAEGAWNVYEITVQDTAIAVALNGVEVSRTNIAPPLQTEGYLAIQCHTQIVQFRNIRIKELP